jgi:hypothetical protein
MISLTNADRVLKDVYLGVVAEEMNKSNPFYAAIQKGSESIDGKRAVLPIRHGVNGGLSSTTETALLPRSATSNFQVFSLELANIYGVIQITDKAVRASENSNGSLVNLLNYQIESLLDSAKFNFNRMLWQDGSGEVARLLGNASATRTIVVDRPHAFREGMIVDILHGTTHAVRGSALRVSTVNRDTRQVTFDSADPTVTASIHDMVTIQGSYNNEIFGLPYVFSNNIESLYGMRRADNRHLLSTTVPLNAILTTEIMQRTADIVEDRSGSTPNMIITNFEARRHYLNLLQKSRSNVDYLNLDGGFKALSFNGIPVIADRFCPDVDMYFINTDDFKLVELCDWQWMEGENGRILSKLSDRAAYSATLVKYANLCCTRPYAQAMLVGIAG